MRYAWIVALAVGMTACDATEDQELETLPAEEITPADGTAMSAGAALQVATLPDGGEYLTDAQGRALYLLEDEDDPTACVDACAAAWPPFTLQAGQAPALTGSGEASGTTPAQQAPSVTGNTPQAAPSERGDAPRSMTLEDAGGTAANGAVRADLIDTVERPDGTQQVTYAGHPLYYYAGDTQAGQVTGQDVHDEWGEWYLVDPSGEELD